MKIHVKFFPQKLAYLSKEVYSSILLVVKRPQYLGVIFTAILLEQFTGAATLFFLPFFLAQCESTDSGGTGGGGSSNGTGDDNTFSTPFLYIWKDGRYIMENDVMMGKPTSLFSTKEKGRLAYESKSIKPDLYHIIQKPTSSDGKFFIQLKEIEPEESHIDFISLTQVIHPRNSLVFTSPKYDHILAFAKTSFQDKNIKSFRVLDSTKNTDITQSICKSQNVNEMVSSRKNTDYKMEAGDAVDIEIDLREQKTLHLFIESYFRDWTSGLISDESRSSLNSLLNEALDKKHPFFLRAFKVTSALAVFSLMWINGFFTLNADSKNIDENETDLLKGWLAPTTVHADVTSGGGTGNCSLLVEYLRDGAYHSLDIIHPRYFKPSYETVVIPVDAIENQIARVRITATKRHFLTNIKVTSESPLTNINLNTLKINQAVHSRTGEDYASTITDQYSKSYMRTIPGDKVTISFGAPNTDTESSSHDDTYVLKIAGHYNPATESVQREAGNWIQNLEPEEQKILAELKHIPI